MERRISCLLLLLLTAACVKPEPEEVAMLRSVLPETYSVTLEKGGEADIPFRVEDPDFDFIYSVGSPDCQVRLMLPGGKAPEEFRLKAVRAAETKGAYVAVVEDLNGDKSYEITASLALMPQAGSDAFVRSPGILFRKEVQEEEKPQETISTGLPLVYVDTDEGQKIRDKENWIPATFRIQGENGIAGLEPVRCGIRGRGNTTWTWPKKPYAIKMEEKQSLFGLPAHKRWVLLANFLDRTLMRNLVSMYVASQMDFLSWTPRCQSVELVLNGVHLGNYLLIEQVRVDKNRVNIKEMKKTDISGEALTGGYLLELDFHYDNEFQWKDHNIPFAVKSPDPEDLTPEQKDYIKAYIAEVSAAVYGTAFQDPEKGYAKYLDVDSFIDYWLVYEVMCNHELGNPGSVYLHKDRGGKLFAGPCWDFDWGVLSFWTSNGGHDLVNRHAIWYDRLFQDPAFHERVKARFQELLPKLSTVPVYMEECRKMLTKSAFLNFRMWNPADDASQNGGSIINGDENLSFDKAVDRLIDNYNTHLKIIQEKL